VLVAAAVCPQTPLLVPQIAGGAAPELAEVRGETIEAVKRLLRSGPDLVIAVAPGDEDEPGAREVQFSGTFRRYGVDLAVGDDVRGEPCAGLLVARWLLDSCLAAESPLCEGWEIGGETGPEECMKLGRALAERAERVALLVMGDGSARRTAKAPGYLDERAVPFDDGIARALAEADTAARAAVDPKAASAVMAAGRAPWQVLAGAVDASGGPWCGRLLRYEAPYGVGYFSAFWEPGPDMEPEPGSWSG
jgi:hypothetical protein